MSPSSTLPVGVIVERTKGVTQWIDHVWRPVRVLVGVPDTTPWTMLADEGERAMYYAGAAEIELHPREAAYYRKNLDSGAPQLWVALRPTHGEPPYTLVAVTADPFEGESLTEAGDDLIETVPMPETIRDAVAAFAAEHHVEEVFVKRKRDRADPEALARRTPRPREGQK
jgi:hypothetical protein